jgi:hypothetical protein
MNRKSVLWKKSYLWITLVFFLGSFTLHWIFGWYSFRDECEQHHQPAEAKAYTAQMMRDTMENWQSEFLQLMWQVAGLAVFVYVGSPTSKEGEDRKEAKIDYILKKLEPVHYEELQKKWEEQYPKE